MENRTINYDSLIKVVKRMDEEAKLSFFLNACINEDLSICQLCLDAKISANIKGGLYGETLLMYYLKSKKATKKVVEWLVNNGADVNGKSIAFSVLTIACEYTSYEIVKFLKDNGAKFVDIKKRGTTNGDLYWTITNQHGLEKKNRNIDYEMIEFLLKSGVPYEKDEKSIYNPIYMAIEMDEDKIVELIFKYYDVCPNLRINGVCLLHEAVSRKSIKIARLLLEKKADVNAKLEKEGRIKKYRGGLTPMDIAVFNKDTEMQALLTDFGGKEFKDFEEEKERRKKEIEEMEEKIKRMKAEL